MRKILLVEDTPAVRHAVAAALRDAGHDVHEARSGSEACCALERDSFDLLLLDYLMADMKGDAVARFARARWTETAVLYLTAYAEFLCLTGKAGEDRLIAKPFSLEALFQAVEEAVGRTPAAQAA